jgi:hypothetical protein
VGDWIAVEPRLDSTLAELPDLVDDFCSAVEEASKPDYFQAAEAEFYEQAIFGKITWPLAHYQALELVADALKRWGRDNPAIPDLARCRESWLVILDDQQEQARAFAEWDFMNRTQSSVLTPVGLGGADNPYDFEHDLSSLDVHKLFAMGADSLWPELSLGGKFDEVTVPVKRFVIEDLLPRVIEDGSWTMLDGVRVGWDPATTLQEWTSDWLPESFWWRHLPDHVSVPIR